MRTVLFLALMISVGASTRLVGQTQDQDWTHCQDQTNGDVEIESCTAFIQASEETDDRVSKAFYNRGIAHSKEDEFDEAISDYGNAIRLDPKFVAAFINRGMNYIHTSAYELAIQDFDEVLRLDPKNFGALMNRGYVRFDQGKFSDAAPDFAAASKLLPKEAYAILWLYLARERAGEDGTEDLRLASKEVPPTLWTAKVIGFYVGTSSADDLLSIAQNGDSQTRRRYLCDISFFLGQRSLIKGDAVEARRFFQQSVDTVETSSITYIAAQAELDRLKQ